MASPTRRAPDLVVLLGVGLLALTACGAEREGTRAPGGAEPPPVDAASRSFAGLYRAEGRTLDEASGETRPIEGTVVLRELDEGYRASAELHTRYPRADGREVSAEVIGTGEGRASGRTLSGTAETQLVLGTVPGVDPGFAFVPRDVGPRIVSTWSAELQRDGSLRIEIRNEPGTGERYQPTRTTLRAERIAPAD